MFVSVRFVYEAAHQKARSTGDVWRWRYTTRAYSLFGERPRAASPHYFTPFQSPCGNVSRFDVSSMGAIEDVAIAFIGAPAAQNSARRARAFASEYAGIATRASTELSATAFDTAASAQRASAAAILVRCTRTFTHRCSAIAVDPNARGPLSPFCPADNGAR